MTVQHNTLTGSDLHEPKGVDNASADNVYVANGAGSGTWQKVGADQINQSDFQNVNQGKLCFRWEDSVSTSANSTTHIPLTSVLTINKIAIVVTSTSNGSAFTGNHFDVKDASGSSMGVISFSSTTSGTIETLSPSSNNSFTADTALEIEYVNDTSEHDFGVSIMIDYTLQ